MAATSIAALIDRAPDRLRPQPAAYVYFWNRTALNARRNFGDQRQDMRWAELR